MRVEGSGYRNVLFVCHANTSRSIIADRLLRKLLLAEGRPDIQVRSGGIAAYARDGMLVSMDARLALAEIGIEEPSDAVATDLKVQRHLLTEADLILVMTAEQRRMLAAYPEARGKPVLTVRELAGEKGDVEDPAGQGEETFRWCRNEISRCLTKGLPALLGSEPASIPTGASVEPWEVLSTDSAYECRIFTVHRHTSWSPRTHTIHEFHVLDVCDWVNIIPLTPDQRVVMVRQYRHGTAGLTLEVPGGMVDAADSDAGAAARREMLEESGYDSDVIEPLGATHPNPAIQGNWCHSFVARDVVRRGVPQNDRTEHTEPVLVPLSRIPHLIRSGEISHALVIVAFHRLALTEERPG